MTAGVLDFVLPPALEAREPAEARGLRRDEVRLLVTNHDADVHSTMRALPQLLRPGDLVVVNTSATLAAAVRARRDDGGGVVVHFSAELGPGRWAVELRRPVAGSTAPYRDPVAAGERLALPGGGTLTLGGGWPTARARLRVAELDLAEPVTTWLARHGRPIRYPYVPRDWPLDSYQTIFATDPGSAEMPSAGRAFTPGLVVALVARGVRLAPVTLHTGVSSVEADEDPYPEWFSVPAATAELVAATRAAGGRVVAVGTTVVRAMESAVDVRGGPVAASGWTRRVVSRDDPPRLCDALLTGFHEPRASHLRLLEAFAGNAVLQRAYAAALAGGYLWHEFGDVHLVLPAAAPG